MTAETRATLYTYFQNGDRPTQQQFVDLIDSSLNLAETSAQTITSDVSALGTLAVSGAFAARSSARIDGDLTVGGSFTVSGGIGNVTCSAITVTDVATLARLVVTGSASVGSNLTVTGTITAPAGTVGTNGSLGLPGIIGEIIEGSAADGSVAMSVNTPKTVTFIPVGPGQYNIGGTLRYTPTASTAVTTVLGGIGVSADVFTMPTKQITAWSCVFQTGADVVISTPTVMVRTSASANYYLNAQINFGSGAVSAGGYIWAERVR